MSTHWCRNKSVANRSRSDRNPYSISLSCSLSCWCLLGSRRIECYYDVASKRNSLDRWETSQTLHIQEGTFDLRRDSRVASCSYSDSYEYYEPSCRDAHWATPPSKKKKTMKEMGLKTWAGFVFLSWRLGFHFNNVWLKIRRKSRSFSWCYVTFCYAELSTYLDEVICIHSTLYSLIFATVSKNCYFNDSSQLNVFVTL